MENEERPVLALTVNNDDLIGAGIFEAVRSKVNMGTIVILFRRTTNYTVPIFPIGFGRALMIHLDVEQYREAKKMVYILNTLISPDLVTDVRKEGPEILPNFEMLNLKWQSLCTTISDLVTPSSIKPKT